MNHYFPEIKKNFGFGCMRLPMVGDDIDSDAFCAMIDKFIDSGFNYFDTARPYHRGFSEKMIKTCLADRHDRSEFCWLTSSPQPSLKRKRTSVL